MGVDIQRGAAGHVADDSAQRLDVHSMLQRGGGEGVPEIVEPEALTLRPLQHYLEPFPDGGRILLQKAVEVLPGDTPQTLQRRMFSVSAMTAFPKSFICPGSCLSR